MTDRVISQRSRPAKRLVYKTITVPATLQRACDEFNLALFFECHETLEEVWQEEHGELRDLYKGLIQVAAAFVHLSRANYFGARRLCQTALGYLQPYREAGAMGFDVAAICQDASQALDRLQALGPARIAEFDLARRPVYAIDRTKLSSEARRWGAWGFDPEGVALRMEIAVIE